MEYKKNLSEPWFSLILLGLKTVEGRLNKGDFKNMKVNDIVIWSNNDFGFTREITTKIKKITHYSTFKEYLINEKLSNTLPVINSIDHGIAVYKTYFPNIEQDEIKYGVLAIKLQLFASSDFPDIK